MVRGLFVIIVLGLAILGFNNLVNTQLVKKLGSDLTTEQLETIRGKIYSSPAGSVLGDFIVDAQGSLYGIESQVEDEVITKIEKLKNSNQEIEVKGLVKDDLENYGEKKIIIKTVKTIDKITEGSSCEDLGGSVELRKVCVFPDSK